MASHEAMTSDRASISIYNSEIVHIQKSKLHTVILEVTFKDTRKMLDGPITY